MLMKLRHDSYVGPQIFLHFSKMLKSIFIERKYKKLFKKSLKFCNFNKFY